MVLLPLKYLFFFLLCGCAFICPSDAFITPQSRKIRSGGKPSIMQRKSSSVIDRRKRATFQNFPSPSAPAYSSQSTMLYMGYNLPPGKGDDNDITKLISPILTIGAVVLFFLSPLGGIFFAITNSLFAIVLLTPLLLTAGFNAWQFFYTLEAPCPNCGAPARVLKDSEAQPNICLNCGSNIRVSLDGDGIELCNNPNQSGLFNGNYGGGSFFDIFNGGFDDVNGDGINNSEPSPSKSRANSNTIIDVVVDDDDDNDNMKKA